MQDDYKPILVSTEQEQSEMNLYFLHDVHIGKNVEVVNCGSMMNYGGYAVDSAHRIPAEKMCMLKLLDQGRGMETRGFYL